MKQPATVAEFVSCIDTCLAELDGQEDCSIGDSGKLRLPLQAPATSDGRSFITSCLHPPDPLYVRREWLFDSIEKLAPAIVEEFWKKHPSNEVTTLRRLRMALKSCRELIGADGKDETQRSAAPAPVGFQKNQKRRSAGRPCLSNAEDAKLANAWKTGIYESHEKLGLAFGKTKKQVKHALDRHRKRAYRRKKSE